MAEVKIFLIKEYGSNEEPKEISKEAWIKHAEENGFPGARGARSLGWASETHYGFTRMELRPDDETDTIMKEFIAGGELCQ